MGSEPKRARLAKVVYKFLSTSALRKLLQDDHVRAVLVSG